MPRYRIVNHGPDAPDYFPGYGVNLTPFENVAVGIGDNAKDAYEDAVDLAIERGAHSDLFPTNPRGIRRTDSLTREERESEFEWYVVVHW